MRTNLPIYILVLIIFLLSLFAACSHDVSERMPPDAVKGVLDLTDWDFETDGPVNLSGEFEFYWMQHLKSPEFSKEPLPEKNGFIGVPKYWNGYEVEGKKLSGDGYATYRLKVLLHDQRQSLALKFLSMGTAFTVYLNGIRVGSVGKAGKNPETTIPRYFPQVVDIGIETSPMELIFHVSNFHHRRGGAWEAVTLGRENDIREIRERWVGFDLFLFGSIFIMALYHLGLFILRKKDRSTLYFGIFCLLVALRLLTTGERYLIHLFPNMGWELLIKLEYLSFYLALPAFALFLQSLFRGFSNRFLHIIAVLGLAFSCIVLFTQARTFSHTLPMYEVMILITSIYGLYVLVDSSIRKREGATVLLIGFVILSLTVINDILYTEQIIHTGYFAPFGFFIFIFCQAFIHALRFSKSFNTIEKQHLELRDTLQAYKEETMVRLQAEEALGESEERYRNVLNNIEDGYYEVDLAGNLTFFNNALCNILGYPEEEMVGLNNRQYMTEETAEQVYKVFNEVYRTHKAAKAFDWELIRKNGEKRFLETSISLIYDSNGSPIGFRGVGRDITERKEAEEQVRLQQQQLMQASKMVALGTLVSGVAHEINNPNSFIMLNAPILMEAWERAMPVLEEYYEANGDFILGGMKYTEMRGNIPKLFSGILDGTKRIKQIVEDLKNYARQDTADLTQTVDINRVLDSAVSLLSNLITKSTKRFSISRGRHLPKLRGNFQRLEQVMINLIQNACEALAGPEKGVFVSTAYEGAKGVIVVRVEDEGTGIQREILTHITDPFFTTKQDSGGVGLGLSISLRIVEEHGGTLNCTSEPGKGTKAEVLLPVERVNNKLKGALK